jgi:signal transduction histidine kinase
MLDGVWEPSPAMLANCQEEILRLSKLVDDLDLLTGLEWENICLEKTDFELEKLLQAAAEQFAPLARAKGIDLVLELVPGRVEADYGRLKQVFINLLSNALKYTDTGSITLKNAPSGSGWEITVSDTGCGIPREELSRVFERFYRTDKSRARGTGGAGIGLTIAAAIVKAHGGRISAEKSPEGGSVFRVAL